MCRYTVTGSPDGVIRLWASGEAFQRARAKPEASTASASCPTAGSASSDEVADDSAAVVQGALLSNHNQCRLAA